VALVVSGLFWLPGDMIALPFGTWTNGPPASSERRSVTVAPGIGVPPVVCTTPLGSM
jgi:hypothetical protein